MVQEYGTSCALIKEVHAGPEALVTRKQVAPLMVIGLVTVLLVEVHDEGIVHGHLRVLSYERDPLAVRERVVPKLWPLLVHCQRSLKARLLHHLPLLQYKEYRLVSNNDTSATWVRTASFGRVAMHW